MNVCMDEWKMDGWMKEWVYVRTHVMRILLVQLIRDEMYLLLNKLKIIMVQYGTLWNPIF